MGVAGRLAAAEALERRIHLYLEQPELLFGPMTAGGGINTCEDGDEQGPRRRKRGKESVCFGPGPEAGLFYVCPS